MLAKMKIIGTLVAALSGTTAYQAYEHRQELAEAAENELSILMSDSLANLPVTVHENVEVQSGDTAGFTASLADYLESAQGSMQKNNAKLCQGYCDFKEQKCSRLNDADMADICRDDVAFCREQCEGIQTASARRNTEL